MKRPLFTSMLFLAGGICTYTLPADGLMKIMLILVAFMACIFCVGKFKWCGAWVFMAAFMAGYLLAAMSFAPHNKTIDNIADSGNEIRIQGVVVDTGKTQSGKCKIILNTQYFETPAGVLKSNMKIQAILGEDEFVNVGEEIIIKGALSSLELARNPGGFNEFLYARSRKIQYSTYGCVESRVGIQYSISILSNWVKNKVSSVYDKVLPAREASIIKSMIIGDKSGLDDYTKQLYSDAGIYHILAISGLHISILSLFFYYVLNQFITVKAASVATLVLLVMYCYMTGCGVSTVRAVIMSGVIIVGKLIYKDSELIASTSFAAILLLLYEPLYLFDIGFQYSFSAVFGIGFLRKPADRVLGTVLKKVNLLNPVMKYTKFRESFSTCTAIFISTLPVCIYHFNNIAIYQLIVNMIIIPTVSIVVIVGFVMGFTGLFSLFIAHMFSGVLYFVLQFYEVVCKFFSMLPLSKILVATPPYLLAICFFVPIAFSIHMLKGYGADYKKRMKKCMVVSLVYMLAYTSYALYPKAPVVTMLDVGQGDCTVIEQNGEVFIIDGGGWYNREIGQNTGAKVVAPYLDYKGIKNVDAAFISHMDTDHAFGIIELLYAKNIKKIIIPQTTTDNELYRALLDACKTTNTEIVYFKKGDQYISRKAVEFTALSPDMNVQYPNDNNGSLVVFARAAASILFTGDIGFYTEKAIENNGGALQADLLKIPHHGSKYSTSEEFLQTVKPKLAIIGAGKYNTYGHPSGEALSRLLSNHIATCSTNKNGAIIISIKKNKLDVKTMLNTGD